MVLLLVFTASTLFSFSSKVFLASLLHKTLPFAKTVTELLVHTSVSYIISLAVVITYYHSIKFHLQAFTVNTLQTIQTIQVYYEYSNSYC